MITIQEVEQLNLSPEKIVRYAIENHKKSELFQTAKEADLYDRQLNITINEYVKVMFSMSGEPYEDYTASNSKIASNFFHRLNTQRCTYSLGNGVYFANDDAGKIKTRLGDDFDTKFFELGYYSLIHGVSFGFWNMDKLYVFPITQFAPIWDEQTGRLVAGVRFWQIDDNKPLNATLYEKDGYTRYTINPKGASDNIELVTPKKSYAQTVRYNDAGDEFYTPENYSEIPIVPLWGSKLHQSTLVGMRRAIDSFDLIRSGFANDLTDCAQIYWILENCGAMNQKDLEKFRDRLKLFHIVEVPSDSGRPVPYTQEVPYAARQAYLNDIRSGIYEDFGGLDVHAVNADSTNDHLEAAYQPLDENADDFEYQCITCIQQILSLIGEKDMPLFKRNRISNQKEQVELIMLESQYLDDETILNKLPNFTPDEIAKILERREKEDIERFKDDEEPEPVVEDVEDVEGK